MELTLAVGGHHVGYNQTNNRGEQQTGGKMPTTEEEKQVVPV